MYDDCLFTTSCSIIFFVLSDIPHDAACACAGLALVYLDISLIYSIRLPKIDTLLGPKWLLVIVLFRLAIYGHLTGKALVKTYQLLLLNSV